MDITSESSEARVYGYRSSQFVYAATFVIVTLAALVLLNVYITIVCQRMVFETKEQSLTEKCQIAADEVAKLTVLNPSTVSSAVGRMESLRAARVIVTDQAGLSLYDSASASAGAAILLPEVLQALDGSDVFFGAYRSGTIFCSAATPIFYYGTIIGSIYMTEYDSAQGRLIHNLQTKVLHFSLAAEALLLLFSLLYSMGFSRRIENIMSSMRIIQGGDYTHKLEIRGNDELTLLGREVNELTDRLQDSEELRRRFVSDASHEIKTPLASIKLLSDSILQNDMDAETMREFVGDIGSEAERLNRMTAKLLSLTKLDSEHDREIEIIHMGPTIRRVCRMLQPTAGAAKVSLILELENECPILMPEDDLYQIVFNLMENGIKYNVPRGSLTVRLVRDTENAVLTVTDTGMGIPEDAVGHIFERFYRVDKARSRSTGGTGLGLAIVQTIVRNNRGEITVSSTPGKGTCFTVVFPLFDTEVQI